MLHFVALWSLQQLICVISHLEMLNKPSHTTDSVISRYFCGPTSLTSMPKNLWLLFFTYFLELKWRKNFSHQDNSVHDRLRLYYDMPAIKSWHYCNLCVTMFPYRKKKTLKEPEVKLQCSFILHLVLVELPSWECECSLLHTYMWLSLNLFNFLVEYSLAYYS